MTNFEKITASPEALGEFLASLTVATGPWDEEFHRVFCNSCKRENCDGKRCPHQDKRNNPLWWLMLGGKEGEVPGLTVRIKAAFPILWNREYYTVAEKRKETRAPCVCCDNTGKVTIKGVEYTTVMREIKRGMTVQRDTNLVDREVYCAETAERKYQENLRAKGPDIKLGNDHELAQYIENKIADDGYSPEAALNKIKEDGLTFSVTLSKWTVYKYIDDGVFLRLTNKKLPMRGRKKRCYHRLTHRPATRAGFRLYGEFQRFCVTISPISDAIAFEEVLSNLLSTGQKLR